jgi:CBS domain-containing protein
MIGRIMMSEHERIDRFASAYNRVDRALGELLERHGDTQRHGFAARVKIAARRERWLRRYADFLLEVGELRNAIVHNRAAADTYIATPHEKTVRDLEAIERRVVSPERVLPRFGCEVRVVTPDTTLADVWMRIQSDGVSRYPVYDGRRFLGLLTSNGIARWCAEQLTDGRLDIDANAVRVRDVLPSDHRRERVAFLGRTALVDEADDLYETQRTDGVLEAIIITEHGKPDEKPLGIICPVDIASLAT